MNHLVSVIITLYNCEKYVEEALKSVLNQTYKHLEIIVVNDGSTDAGVSIVENLMKSDKRIKLYHQENKGQCAASNFGFQQSTGGYIKFFDADDILTSGVIDSQMSSLKGRGEFEGSFIEYVRFYDDDISTTNKFPRHELVKKDCSPIEYITFTGGPPMYNNAIWLFPRKIYEVAGLWDERLSVNNDGEFFPRVLKYVSRLYYVPDSLVYYRTTTNSLSQQASRKALDSALLSVDLMADHIRSIERNETVEKVIAQSYVQVLEMSYPAHPEVAKKVELRLDEFDKNLYSIPKSGKLYNVVMKLFGWKVAKKMQLAYYKFKYG